MFASHRDACILSRYAEDLSVKLDAHYQAVGLERNIIAYRKLGKSNYEFSADAREFALQHQPCVVCCFDVTGFFDNIDHALLKSRLKGLLKTDELSPDWYSVFRSVTRYSRVSQGELKAHPKFGPRFKQRTTQPIATVRELKEAGVGITRNPNRFGIPQGTPISSALSNLYMVELDHEMFEACTLEGALYQRYSDDIIIICPPPAVEKLTCVLQDALAAHKLEVKASKTDITIFDASAPDAFQYLGFDCSPSQATIRPSSLSKQWRRAKRRIERIRTEGAAAIAAGKADRIYTKELRRKYTPLPGARNFSAYARRAAKTFESRGILRQIIRLERAADAAIRGLNGLKPPT